MICLDTGYQRVIKFSGQEDRWFIELIQFWNETGVSVKHVGTMNDRHAYSSLKEYSLSEQEEVSSDSL